MRRGNYLTPAQQRRLRRGWDKLPPKDTREIFFRKNGEIISLDQLHHLAAFRMAAFDEMPREWRDLFNDCKAVDVKQLMQFYDNRWTAAQAKAQLGIK